MRMRRFCRRFVVLFYLFVCGALSLLNYRYSSSYFKDEPANVANLSNVVDEQSEAQAAPGPSFFAKVRSGLEQLMTKVPKEMEVPYTVTMAPRKKIFSGPLLWPEDTNETDRVLEQLYYVDLKKMKPKTFTIYLPHGIGGWNVKDGNSEFQKCATNNCVITDRATSTYDAAMHRNQIITTVTRHNDDQIWIFYSLESPENTGNLNNAKGRINWTATYRYDSDIVTPYEKFRLYPHPPVNNLSVATKNYAQGKTKKVAWFVSNCFTNNDRMVYAKNLAAHIQVDIYGGCGSLKCSRFDTNCFAMLNKDYKFYLAFENSNCKDYITEKFFYNGLQHDIIPIVMGAQKEEYERSAPPHSFIHVDDFADVKQLAEYLLELDRNQEKYNEYFRWKNMGEFVDTKFWCRLCAMLNHPKRKSYDDLELWWRNPKVCSRGKWPP